MSIRSNLLEAYVGYFEKDTKSLPTPEAREAWAEARIVKDSPRERLRVYLEWNGIIGYTETIYSIATGDKGEI